MKQKGLRMKDWLILVLCMALTVIAAGCGNSELPGDSVSQGSSGGPDGSVYTQDGKNDISPLSGFGLDSTGLENEYTAITAALDEYRNAIRCGLYTEALQEKFEEKLKSAGADIYIEAVQKQMDAWKD